MRVLALDSSTEILSVAIGQTEAQSASNEPGNRAEEVRIIAQTSVDLGRNHAETIIDLVEKTVSIAGLTMADMDLFACTLGPGSFSGLRSGLSATKGFSAAKGRPFVLVPTLDCMAFDYDHFDGLVLPVIDAKRGRYYGALYRNGTREGDWLDLSLADLEALVHTEPRVLVTGPDAQALSAIASGRPGWRIARDGRKPVSRALAAIAVPEFSRRGGDDDEAGPLYLRKSEAEETRDALRGKHVE